MNPGDKPMLREAAAIVLQDADLCTCPMQVFRLARALALVVDVIEECQCPMCIGIMASRFAWYLMGAPEIVGDFHRPGASAMHGPGEKRDENLIGPNC